MSPALLEVEGLDKHFGGVAAVARRVVRRRRGVHHRAHRPERRGEDDDVQSRLAFLRADRGIVRFAGQRIERWRADAIARAGLVRAFQAARVLTRMRVLDNMLLAAQHQPGERLVTTLLAPGRVAWREREVRERAEELLSLVRLSHLSGAYAGTLSGGQRKLLELGRALMVEPRMILLDEPMAGVAPVLGEQLLDHIRELRERRGVTVLVVEHDMDVVMSISDRVIVMDEGHVIAEGPPDAIQRDERVIEAYLGRLGGSGGGPAR